MAERGIPEALATDIREWIRKEGAELPAFLELDLKRTTNPAAVKNPEGYYRGLAQEVRREPLEAVHRARVDVLAAQVATRIEQQNWDGSSKACKCADGKVACGANCPDCQLGRDLEQQEHWKRRRQAARATSAEVPDMALRA